MASRTDSATPRPAALAASGVESLSRRPPGHEAFASVINVAILSYRDGPQPRLLSADRIPLGGDSSAAAGDDPYGSDHPDDAHPRHGHRDRREADPWQRHIADVRDAATGAGP